MSSRAVDRGITPLIGFVILFGFLVITLGLFQITVVPSENMEAELNHHLRVQEDFQDLRAGIVSTGRTDDLRTVTIALGTDYQQRSLLLNPPPPTGTLASEGSEDTAIQVSVTNAIGTDDVGDFWNGSAHGYNTGRLSYRPHYNVYRAAPPITYENSVLFTRFNSTTEIQSSQLLVDGRRIYLVTLDGTVERTGSQSVPIDITLASASSTTVVLSDDGNPIQLEIPTTLSLATWESLLSEESAGDSGHVTDLSMSSIPGSQFEMLTITLESGIDYEFRMAKAVIGDGAQPIKLGYVKDVEGNNSIVPNGSEVKLVAVVRDRFNNPAIGYDLMFTTDDGEFSDGTMTVVTTTDEEGRARVVFDPSVTGDAVVLAGIDSDRDGAISDENARNRTSFHIEAA